MTKSVAFASPEAQGRTLAEDIAGRRGTRDVLHLAAQLGVVVRSARWMPVTAGECDRARREIVVNEAAIASVAPERGVTRARIIAHELAHLVACGIEDEEERQFGRRAARARAERRAHAFAAALTRSDE